MKNYNDLTGQRFGRLSVTGRAENGPKGQPRWICLCDCKSICIVYGQNLRRGNSRSCGCLAKEIRLAPKKHGLADRHPLYETWLNMRRRCLVSSCKAYKWYGARGITICDRWDNFLHFVEDMGPRPVGTSLDRKDNDGPYSPENCRWAGRSEQRENTRSCNQTEVNGVRYPTLSAACAALGVPYPRTYYRLQKGWGVDRAFGP